MNNKEVEEHHNKMRESLIERGIEREKYKPVAVGWLDITEPFEKGDVPKGFVEKLKLLNSVGLRLLSMGHHDCEFCIEEGKEPHQSSSQKILRDEKYKVDYIHPDMIFHYMEEHNFKPSKEFIEFIMSGRGERIAPFTESIPQLPINRNL